MLKGDGGTVMLGVKVEWGLGAAELEASLSLLGPPMPAPGGLADVMSVVGGELVELVYGALSDVDACLVTVMFDVTVMIVHGQGCA